MVITLSENLKSYIKNKVDNGTYENTSAVVAEALQLLKAQEEKKETLLKEIQKGIDDVEAGRVTTQTPKEIFNEVVAQRKSG